MILTIHLLARFGAGLFVIAGCIFASAAYTLHNKGWQRDAFEAVMWALGCAFAAVLLW